ncbi:MAG: AzlD domain-containing protein [Clostridiales bacterium]|nr:AzlD domain-containing protein [Clostridiales bacterium]
MSPWCYWLLGVVVMAAVTYIPRMLPLSLMRKRIESPFLQAFLFYMPVAVLGAMTFPAALYATSSVYSAAAGLTAALLMALWGRGLLSTAVVSAAVVFAVETAMLMAGVLHIS